MEAKHMPVAREGLMLVGLPESSLLIVQALARSTGKSYPDVIALALQYLAGKALNSDDQKALAIKLRQLND